MSDIDDVAEMLQAAQAKFPGSQWVNKDDTGDNRPNVYWDNEVTRWVYRASSLGNCTNALIQTRRGIQGGGVPESVQAKFDQGTAMENIIIARLAKETEWKELNSTELQEHGTLSPVTRQLECALNIGKKAVVRVHPDGVVEGSDGRRKVLEVKKFAKSTYKSYQSKGIDVFPSYPWQFAVEMLATKLPGVYVIGVMEDEKDRPNDESGAPDLMWEPGISFIDVKEYDTPPRTLLEIVKRVMGIENAAEDADAGESPEGGFPCEYKMFPCPYFADHNTEVGVWAKGATVRERNLRGELPDFGSPEYDMADSDIAVRQAITNLMVANAVAKDAKAKQNAAKGILDRELKQGRSMVLGDYFTLGNYELEVVGKQGNKDHDKIYTEMKKAGIDVDAYVVRKPDMEWLQVKNTADKKAGE